ncbi:MAG: hypothetical protein IJV35_03340 [Neisseriaceae bacterium]|nr:hypothetical protein [Neisseriaceae bacterium]
MKNLSVITRRQTVVNDFAIYNCVAPSRKALGSRKKNRGNPVLPLGKTNAARRFNDIAKSHSVNI